VIVVEVVSGECFDMVFLFEYLLMIMFGCCIEVGEVYVLDGFDVVIVEVDCGGKLIYYVFG